MNRTLPTILHLDADAFFVSVELALQPEYRGKKVAVGGRERGIIASASYEARAAGVYTPMPTSKAFRVCPDLILLPHKGNYGAVSRRMFELCEELTPLVEKCSIDEGYLDLQPCGIRDLATLEQVAKDLQTKIGQTLDIPVSIGLGANKFVSQIASKLKKPRGFVVVSTGTEAAFLAPLPIGRIPGIGDKTEARLHERGVRLIGDLLRKSDSEMQSIFGRDWRGMRALALGEDDRPVEIERGEAKSYSQQETFVQNISDREFVSRTLKRMVDELMMSIRADGKRARTLTIKIRYPDFSEESRGRSLPESSDLERPFYPLVSELLMQIWDGRRPLRLVSARLSGIEDGGRQLDLFNQVQDEKRRRLAGVLDQLNTRTGRARVTHGHQLDSPKMAD